MKVYWKKVKIKAIKMIRKISNKYRSKFQNYFTLNHREEFGKLKINEWYIHKNEINLYIK